MVTAHIIHVLGKLGATVRTRAAIRAAQLDLLDGDGRHKATFEGCPATPGHSSGALPHI